jgi:hypothetical protein
MKELSLHILDIFTNSINAEASLVRVTVREAQETLRFRIVDNGKGMGEEMLRLALSPFATTRTTRKVGMGLPLASQLAEQTGGRFRIKSRLGKGTAVDAVFNSSHIDMLPLGDLKGSALAMVMSLGASDLVFAHRYFGREASFDTREFRSAFGGEIDFGQPELFSWLREYIEDLYEQE